MHREQVEAVVEEAIEKYFGHLPTLREIATVLQRTNVKLAAAGESTDVARQANLIHSMFISHTNLARAVGDAAEALGKMQERLVQLESTIAPLQEAVINLQVRVKHLEQGGPTTLPPAGL